MNILFRTDSSSTIGAGHIMRDLVLAKRYQDDNIIFAVQDLQDNLNAKILEAGYTVEILQDNSLDEFQKVIDRYAPDLIVVDSYDIDYAYEKELKTQSPHLKLMILDDTYEKHYCDILLNHNMSADEKKYKGLVPQECELRCGTRYTLLRDEFIEEKKIQREKLYNYVLAFGGADSANLNISVLKVLLAINPYSKIIVITTTANKNLKSLKVFVEERENIILEVNSDKVAKLINQSEFAIITPSVIANEAYFLEVPFMAIKTADNQKEISSFLLEKGYVVLKSFEKKKLDKYLKRRL